MAKQLRHKDAGAQLTQTEDNATDRHYLTGGATNDMVVYDAINLEFIGKTRAEILALLSGQAGADFSLNTHKLTNVVDPTSAQDAATKAYADTHVGVTSEAIQDVAGAMFTGNTETFITATYQDADGTIDLVVPVKDEDNMASDSATYLATQQSIKAYADLRLLISEIDDTPVNGVTTAPISSNWAYDHVAAADPHTGYVLESLFDADTFLYASSDNTPVATSPANVMAALSGHAAAEFSFNGQNINIGAGLLKTTNLAIKEGAADYAYFRNAADDAYKGVYLHDLISMGGSILLGANTSYIKDNNTDDDEVIFQARDNTVGRVEVARMQGAADPYFQATLPMVLNPSSAPGTLVEGHFWYDSTADVLKFRDASATQTLLREADVDDTPVNGETADPISSNWAYDHVANADPHTGYVLESLFDAQTVIHATSDNTPVALSVTEQTLVGRLTGGNISAVAIGIADNNILQVDHASPADNDYAKFTAAGIEGRSYTEVKADLDLEIGTDILAQQTIGIANDNLVEMDDADAADNDYAKFTANGLEGRSYAEVRSDLSVADISGTPTDGQVAIWTGATQLEGSTLGEGVMVAANDATAAEKATAIASGGAVCDGTADDVQIQAAWDALTSGGVLILSSGTFNCAALLNLDDVNNMIFRGQGYSTIIKQTNSADIADYFMYFDNLDDCYIGDFRIQPNLDNQTQKGYGTVRFGDVNDSTIERVWVDGSLGAEDGFNFFGCQRDLITKCKFTECDETTTSAGIRFTDVSQGGVYNHRNTVELSYFYDIGEHAIKNYGSAGSYGSHNVFRRNIVIDAASADSSKAGIWVDDYDEAIENYIDMPSGSNYAIVLHGSHPKAYHNTCYEGRILVENATYWDVSHNDVDLVAVDTMALTVTNGDYGVAIANHLKGTSSNGDIYCAATSTDNLFEGNYSQNTTRFMTDAGTNNTFRNNHAAVAVFTSPASGTYRNNPGGGYGIGDEILVAKTADETVNNSTTLQDDDELLAALPVSTTWAVEIQFRYISGTTPDIKVAWSLPTGATMIWAGGDQSSSGFTQTKVNLSILGDGFNRICYLYGTIIMSTTAGDAVFQWAQNTAEASDTKVLEDSWIKFTRVK